MRILRCSLFLGKLENSCHDLFPAIAHIKSREKTVTSSYKVAHVKVDQ